MCRCKITWLKAKDKQQSKHLNVEMSMNRNAEHGSYFFVRQPMLKKENLQENST